MNKVTIGHTMLHRKKPHKLPKILFLGEITWDQLWVVNDLPHLPQDYQLLREQESAGGCSLNSAMCLNSAKIPVDLAGNDIGNDVRGKKLYKSLKHQGLHKFISINQKISTAFCQCLVSKKNADRAFILNHENLKYFNKNKIDYLIKKALSEEYSIIFLQAYLRSLAGYCLPKLKSFNGFLMTQDLSPEDPLVPYFDCIQISISETQRLTQKSVTKIAKKYWRGRVQSLLITQGSKGSHWLSKQKEYFYQASEQVKAVDTTGCGDAFRSGFLLGLFQNQPIQTCLKLGTQLGALKAKQLGSHLILKPKEVLSIKEISHCR